MNSEIPEDCLCDQGEAVMQALEKLFYSSKPVHWAIPDTLRPEFDRVFTAWARHMQKHGRKEPQRG